MRAAGASRSTARPKPQVGFAGPDQPARQFDVFVGFAYAYQGPPLGLRDALSRWIAAARPFKDGAIPRAVRLTLVAGTRRGAQRTLMLDHIVVVGAGQTGGSILPRLSNVAPIVLVDTSSSALEETPDTLEAPTSLAREARNSLMPAPSTAAFPFTKKLADGTSRLVLEDLRGPRDRRTALVAATGEDRVNLEICRLGVELDFQPVIAIAIDPSTGGAYEALGARPIARATILGDVVERALRYDGLAIVSSVGLGKGDVIEVRVLPTSPYIGTSLSELHAEKWRVAALYRAGELVVPTGETTIEADDRALLVGEPQTLSRIVEDFRVGTPDFPLRYGPNLAVALFHGPDDKVEMEAQRVAKATHVRELVSLRAGSPDESLDARMLRVAEAHPGLVIAPRPRYSLVARLRGVGGEGAQLCDRVAAPVLFACGAASYGRVICALAPGLPNSPIADLAIDLARTLRLPLAVVVVDLPSYFGSGEEPIEPAVARTLKRAELHRMSPSVVRKIGNPISELRALIAPDDLLVVARTRGQRDSFSSPDIALRLCRLGRCSTMVLTVARP